MSQATLYRFLNRRVRTNWLSKNWEKIFQKSFNLSSSSVSRMNNSGQTVVSYYEMSLSHLSMLHMYVKYISQNDNLI